MHENTNTCSDPGDNYLHASSGHVLLCMCVCTHLHILAQVFASKTDGVDGGSGSERIRAVRGGESGGSSSEHMEGEGGKAGPEATLQLLQQRLNQMQRDAEDEEDAEAFEFWNSEEVSPAAVRVQGKGKEGVVELLGLYVWRCQAVWRYALVLKTGQGGRRLPAHVIMHGLNEECSI